MASGFPGGGPDFFSAGRSTGNHPSQSPYTTQLSQIFLDHSSNSQIAQHRLTPTNFASQNLIGKRTLADFQAHHQIQQQQQQPNINQAALNALFLRSVKPRMYQHTSPISTLSPIEFSANNMSPEIPSLSHRYGLPLLQQQQQQQQPLLLRPQPMNLSPAPTSIQHSTNQTLPGMGYMNSLQIHNNKGAGVGGGQDSEKKMMNRLQELEKQLLDDNDEEEGDAVSVITNTNSEWSETIQNIITSSSPNAISPSPTSSSSSSSSSSSTSVSKQTVIEAASALYEGKTDVATEILMRISQVSNPRGNSEQRLMEYMLMALKSRVNSVENPPPVTALLSKEHVESTHLLYELSPCFKLGFMAANLAILEAMLLEPPNSSNGFHVIDFDIIGQGGQYMNLLQALSASQNGKPATLKITAVANNAGCGGEERVRLIEVGDRLSLVAKKSGVSLNFNIVSCKPGDLSRDSLGCEPDEPLAVNFAFKLYRMPDESVSTENPRDELLRRVKGLAPRVVTMVEQEMNANTAPFMARVNEACAYYGALFESIESTVERENSERVKVEEGLGRKLGNSVACEGRERVERCEVFGKWRARMGMAGFELKPLGRNVAESMKAWLSSGNRVNPGFTVKEENGGVCFGWMGKTLTVASAWR